MSLPVIAAPLSDESLSGWLMRTSERNVIPSAIQLLRSLGFKPRVDYSAKQMEVLAEECGVAVESILIRNPARQSTISLLRHRFQRNTGTPVCPACLAEQVYLRQAWSHDQIVACPHHNVGLVDVCPSCETPLTMDRQRVDTCDCGQALCDVPTQPASPAELAIAALLQEMPHPARQSLPVAFREGITPADMSEFLEFLEAHLGGDSTASKHRKSPRPKTLIESRSWIARLWPLLADWPQGFTAAIDQRLQRTEGPGLAKRLGSWYRTLHKEFATPHYDFVRDTLAQHTARHFDGHLNLRLSTIDPKHVEEKCWLSPAEAGRFIGVGAELLRAAVLSGEVKGKLTVSGANRFVSLHRDEVETIRRNRLAYLTATDVRNRLGVSKVLFQRLLQAGALRRYSKRQRPPLVSAEFREKEVDALVERLSSNVDARALPKEQQLGLHDMSARRGLTPDQIIGVLQCVLDGRLRPTGQLPDLPGLAGLRFDRREVEALLAAAVEDAHEPTLLITDVVRMQGWKHESILAWIKAGHLRVVHEQRGQQQVTAIPVSALLDFLSRYLVLADAAERVGSKSNWILRGLMPAGVAAVGGASLPGGGQRGVLLEIDALLHAAQWNKRLQHEVPPCAL
ncbi:TniQ family protein [Pseudomonas aeruginosa]|nr:TniQ family protein [Pseudomonas aeruginosa]MCT1237853.1 TniQ family protein [Pseudomonas aeruginosa]